MKFFARLACVTAGAVLLGGCQSFALTSWMFKHKRPGADSETVLAANTAGALEQGRADLRSGNLSAAVASFNIAQLDESTRAEADNGLAVAYAKLGRPDLAERYFRAAIAAAPEDPKFAANLLRLQSQVLLAKQTAADHQLAAISPPAAAQPVMASADTLGGPVTRISRGEIHVQSRGATAEAPNMAVAYKEAATPKPVAKLSEEAPTAPSPAAPKSGPVTVVFGE